MYMLRLPIMKAVKAFKDKLIEQVAFKEMV
jgi:hypothetical protein